MDEKILRVFLKLVLFIKFISFINKKSIYKVRKEALRQICWARSDQVRGI